ncbi:MAG: tetratricopeptide repeat protein [Blastocatellia bacterium]|nr:tetratricopeptide repeat protein [Blastocatellia bacterium]
MLIETNGFSLLTGQTGNTVTGYIFGEKRQPLYDVNVELLDEFSRTLARAKTNASGRYIFNGFPSGRYRIRVLTSGSDFAEEEQDFEVQNFRRVTENGATVTSGFENVQRDFYLKRKKPSDVTSRPQSIFGQNIPEAAKAKYENAIKLLEDKKESEGLKELKSAIENFPDYYEAIERLGTEYIKLKHFEAAQILLSRAVEINSRGNKSWYGLGYALYSLNRFEEALKTVAQALELIPNSVESLFLSGVTLRKLKRYNESLKHLIKAKSLAKDSLPDVHWQLALLYAHNLNRYNDAADELELYLKANPENVETENIKKLIKQFREKAKIKN